MAKFIETRPLKAKPGATFTYANGNPLLMSRIIKDAVGGDGAAVMQFQRRQLFDKLGMEHVTFEQDATGTPIGSSHMWATARDWARFGLLYLNDGVVGGERILPAGWADYSARLTPGSEYVGYGAGFWTNRGGSDGAKHRPHMPADSYMARGVHGQYTIIIPSARTVIVRMGDAYTHYDDIDAVDRLAGEVLAATGG
jgi:CubicO group peptidase (beta-lactamase class C family)